MCPQAIEVFFGWSLRRVFMFLRGKEVNARAIPKDQDAGDVVAKGHNRKRCPESAQNKECDSSEREGRRRIPTDRLRTRADSCQQLASHEWLRCIRERQPQDRLPIIFGAFAFGDERRDGFDLLGVRMPLEELLNDLVGVQTDRFRITSYERSSEDSRWPARHVVALEIAQQRDIDFRAGRNRFQRNQTTLTRRAQPAPQELFVHVDTVVDASEYAITIPKRSLEK